MCMCMYIYFHGKIKLAALLMENSMLSGLRIPQSVNALNRGLLILLLSAHLARLGQAPFSGNIFS